MAEENIIKLKRPITIDGKKITDLAYDTDEITIGLQAKAEVESKKIGSTGEVKLQESDYTYHIFLGMAAVLAVNPSFDWNDLKRIKGKDLNKLAVVGRSYFLESEASEESSSEDALEPTADGSIQA